MELQYKMFTEITKQKIKSDFQKVLGLDIEKTRLKRVLTRSSKNNVIVVGEQGVGKTAFINSYILDLLESNNLTKVYKLDNKSLFNYILSDKSSSAELENSISHIESGIILIDDINEILLLDKRNIFKLSSILSDIAKNSRVNIIATSTPAIFRIYFEKDSMFNSYFEVINISEPSAEISEKILEFITQHFLSLYNISYTNEQSKLIVSLSRRYLYTGKFFPSKAIDLLDESLAKAKIEGKKQLDINDVKQIISERTGIPVSNITTSDKDRLLTLEKSLSEKVIGQSNAVNLVAKIIKRSRVGIKDPKRPIGSFLFIGPSGVGKTELAKTIAEEVFLDDSSLIRLDMSEYSEAHNVQRLIGAPPGYVGYEEGGQLTNPVWDRPYSLVLLDEIEKAHPRVFDIFLQIIDEGRLTDGQGRTVNFNNTVIIATSNVGVDEMIKRQSEVEKDKFYNQVLVPTLLKFFRPEFINRFDELVFFNTLGFEDIKQVVQLRLKELSNRLKDIGIKVSYRPETIEYITKMCNNPKFGVRPVNRIIREKIENPIAEKILKSELVTGQDILI